MKIAILTSGILPVPAVQGGAVENLIDFYLEYNDHHRLHDITVYSVYHPDVEHHPARQSEVNHYHYIDVSSPWAKVRKKLYQFTHGKEYYHYTIEFFLEQALKHIRKQHYDLIILENRPGYALKLKGRTDARLVYHLHNDILNSDTKHAKNIYDAAIRIITVSNYIASRVRTINSYDTKCVTVHNGIDLKKFAQKEATPPHQSLTIVFMGRMIKEKGIEELIDAMLLLQDPQYSIRLMIIGGSFYANSCNTEFTKGLEVKAEPIKNKVEFTGFVPYNEIPVLLQQADIAVLPSIWPEPFGLTCVEAMASGLPLITTNSGGIPETTSDDCAILLDINNLLPQKIAKAIISLYSDAKLRKRMGESARKQAEHFSKEGYAQSFLDSLTTI